MSRRGRRTPLRAAATRSISTSSWGCWPGITCSRSVGFYAGQLNLTPKYLTTIIRKTSGRTAVQWIDDYVVLEAKNLLKYSTMSIQEISYYLNFPNQSFFGKYFKNHTGMTPTAYRLGK